MENKFHLSIPCKNIKKTRLFYEKLGFKTGRKNYNWFDLNLDIPIEDNAKRKLKLTEKD